MFFASARFACLVVQQAQRQPRLSLRCRRQPQLIRSCRLLHIRISRDDVDGIQFDQHCRPIEGVGQHMDETTHVTENINSYLTPFYAIPAESLIRFIAFSIAACIGSGDGMGRDIDQIA